jgi:hypothetical protein
MNTNQTSTDTPTTRIVSARNLREGDVEVVTNFKGQIRSSRRVTVVAVTPILNQVSVKFEAGEAAEYDTARWVRILDTTTTQA